MAPKTKSRTAIWYFAKEKMDTGKISAANIREAIEGVYVEWKSMPSHERAPYERRLEQWRQEIKGEKNIIPSVKPRVKTEYYQEDDDSVFSRKNSDKTLEKMLQALTKVPIKNEDSSSIGSSLIKSKCWYIIKFQTFCRAETNPIQEHHYDPYFVLAEVSILEYSLEKGITNEFHSFIKPNKVPLGYNSQCMDCSRDEHQIPLHGFEAAKRKTYNEVYNYIKKLVGKVNATVFCMQKDIEATKFGLNFLHNNSHDNNNSHNPMQLQVIDLENLIVHLAKYSGVDYSIESAHDLLTSYAFDYTSNSKCEYHEELGITYCSLGIVKKWSYLISDNICQFYDVELTPKHIPVVKAVGVVYTNDNSSYNSSYKSSRVSSYRNSTASLNGYTSNSSAPLKFNRYDDADEKFNDNESNSSTIISRISESTRDRNMPTNDIRQKTRQLVSDKLSSNFSTIGSSIRTNTNSRYEQYNNENGNHSDMRSVVSDSINSNISSAKETNIYENYNPKNMDMGLLDEEEEDDMNNGWTEVDKRGKRAPKHARYETQSVLSDHASNIIHTNESESMKSSTARSFVGRGRSLTSKRN